MSFSSTLVYSFNLIERPLCNTKENIVCTYLIFVIGNLPPACQGLILMARINTITASQNKVHSQEIPSSGIQAESLNDGHELLQEQEARYVGKVKICCRYSLSLEQDLQPSKNSFPFLFWRSVFASICTQHLWSLQPNSEGEVPS